MIIITIITYDSDNKMTIMIIMSDEDFKIETFGFLTVVLLSYFFC